VAVSEEEGKQFVERTAAHIPEAERPGDRSGNKGRVADRCQVDEGDPVGKRTGEIRSDTEREPGLPDPTRTGQGQEADIIPQQESADSGSLSLPSDERRERDRKSVDVLTGQSGGHDASALGFPMIAASIVENVT